ncbi:unnamed protein product [Protopolystoma xenopodis]|uniref:Uncharacterized protein n=1 Tax=Protopolystoma xenopodis TaxID=117903 RepID=A0A448WI65_9PLAT|nr:unnamed protein product [Protopolystoma xenopodis]
MVWGLEYSGCRMQPQTSNICCCQTDSLTSCLVNCLEAGWPLLAPDSPKGLAKCLLAHFWRFISFACRCGRGDMRNARCLCLDSSVDHQPLDRSVTPISKQLLISLVHLLDTIGHIYSISQPSFPLPTFLVQNQSYPSHFPRANLLIDHLLVHNRFNNTFLQSTSSAHASLQLQNALAASINTTREGSNPQYSDQHVLVTKLNVQSEQKRSKSACVLAAIASSQNEVIINKSPTFFRSFTFALLVI